MYRVFDILLLSPVSHIDAEQKLFQKPVLLLHNEVVRSLL